MQQEEKQDEAATDGEAIQSRIVIRPDGEVVIENLSMDLLELAQLLDPDSEIGCDLAPQREGETEPTTE